MTNYTQTSNTGEVIDLFPIPPEVTRAARILRNIALEENNPAYAELADRCEQEKRMPTGRDTAKIIVQKMIAEGRTSRKDDAPVRTIKRDYRPRHGSRGVEIANDNGTMVSHD